MLPLKFIPVYFERVWGGRALESRLRRALPSGAKIGESREISDRPEFVSAVAAGEFRGENFRDVLRAHGEEIMGAGWTRERRFPLIVKWLDCAETSSVQIHPTAESARRFGAEKKTEAWYFHETAPGAEFFAGLRGNVSHEELRCASLAGTAEEKLRRHSSAAGACVLIAAGTLHAAGAGNLILEVQESSDSTFRLCDRNRLDASGRPRALHVEEVLASIDFAANAGAFPQENGAGTGGVLCRCGSFSLRKIRLLGGEIFRVPAGEQPRLAVALRGGLSLCGGNGGAGEFSVGEFETALFPQCGDYAFSAVGETELLLIENFYAMKN